MVVVLDRDTHRFKRAHGDFADVVPDIDRVDVEVSGVVEELDSPLVLEVEVLRLRPDVHVRASVVLETAQGANQDVARVAVVRRSVGGCGSGRTCASTGPRRSGKGSAWAVSGTGKRDHVALLDPLVALNGGAVEAHSLLKGARQLLRGDREGLEEAQDVGEPEADRADVMLLHVVHDVVDARERQPVPAVHLIDVLLHLVPTFFRCVQVLVPVHGHAPLRYEKGLGRGPRAPGFRLGQWEVCGNADEGRTRGCRGPPKREAARFPETLRPGPGRRHLRPGTTALMGRSLSGVNHVQHEGRYQRLASLSTSGQAHNHGHHGVSFRTATFSGRNTTNSTRLPRMRATRSLPPSTATSSPGRGTRCRLPKT